jgi:hypothetical protein
MAAAIATTVQIEIFVCIKSPKKRAHNPGARGHNKRAGFDLPVVAEPLHRAFETAGGIFIDRNFEIPPFIVWMRRK